MNYKVKFSDKYYGGELDTDISGRIMIFILEESNNLYTTGREIFDNFLVNHIILSLKTDEYISSEQFLSIIRSIDASEHVATIPLDTLDDLGIEVLDARIILLEDSLFILDEEWYNKHYGDDSNKVLRTLATGQSDITRHESLNEKKLMPKYALYIGPYIIIKYEYLEDTFKSILQSNDINADKGSATIIGLSTNFTTEQTLIYKILLLTWTENGIRKYTTLRNEDGILTSSGTESEDNTFTLHVNGLYQVSDENIEETVMLWLNIHDEGLSIPEWDDLVYPLNEYTWDGEPRISFVNLSYFQDVIEQIWLENNITLEETDPNPTWIDSLRGYDAVLGQDLDRYAILARQELSGDYTHGGTYFMTMQDSELLLFCVTGVFNDGLYIDNQSAAMRPKEWIFPGNDEIDFNDWINNHSAILITQLQAERLIAAANYNAVNNISIENNI